MKLRLKQQSDPESLSFLLCDGIKNFFTLPNFLPKCFLKVYRIGCEEHLSIGPLDEYVVNVCYVPCTGSDFLRDSPSPRKDSTLSLQSLQSNEDIKPKFSHPKVGITLIVPTEKATRIQRMWQYLGQGDLEMGVSGEGRKGHVWLSGEQSQGDKKEGMAHGWERGIQKP